MTTISVPQFTMAEGRMSGSGRLAPPAGKRRRDMALRYCVQFGEYRKRTSPRVPV